MVTDRVSRRQFLELGALLAAASFSVRAVNAQEPFAGQYLVAEKTASNLLGQGSPETQHWHFKTESGVPILRAKQGQEARFRLINSLDEDVWVHFFGVRGPSDMMTVSLPAGGGEAREVVFTPPDAGTFWFGPFLHVSKQREMGLYGMLIVEEAEPLEGLVDVPLIIDDWKISDTGVIDSKFDDMNEAIADGRLGNWFTVNGGFKPNIAMPEGAMVRLRLLNVANSRTLSVLFKGAALTLLARDGQPLKPVALGVEPLQLAPGQRADLLFDSTNERVVMALDLFDDVVEAAVLLPDAKARHPAPESIALTPNPLPPVDPAATPHVVTVVIEGGAKGGLASARVGNETLDLRALIERGLAWSMNGIAGFGPSPLFTVKKGEVVVLEIENRSSLVQPMHIHGHAWHLLDVDGKVAEGQSWRDTAEIPANAKVKLAFVAGDPGTWALQSLMAERQDAGLVGAFTVTDMP